MSGIAAAAVLTLEVFFVLFCTIFHVAKRDGKEIQKVINLPFDERVRARE